MAKIYMNRFAIEEDDQNEIHVKDYTDSDRMFAKPGICKSADEVGLQVQWGTGYYQLGNNIKNYSMI